MKINEELQALIPPLQESEYIQLEKNIISDGCRDPLTVWDGVLIDGHNRYKICTEHDISFETSEMEFESIDHAKEWMINLQSGRRNLSDWWRFELIQAKKALLINAGKVKMSDGGKGLSTMDKPCDKSHNTQTKVADELGWSIGKVARADKVMRNADTETKDKLKDGDITINQAYQDIVTKEKNSVFVENVEQQKEEIELSPLAPLDKQYHVLSIDPPWPYELKVDKNGKPIRKKSTYNAKGRRSANFYPEMSIQQIKDMPIPAQDDCVLWLWTTHRFLPDSFEILKAWGFEYKATMVWNKEKIGMGHWLRMQCEFVLLAVKGKPVWTNTTERDILTSPRREHSRKPDEFYTMVNEICVGAKLEYFSREKRDGWDQIGNDTEKF